MNYGLWHQHSLLYAGILLVLGLATSHGQDTPSGNQDQSNPKLSLNPSRMLQNFEPSAGEEYTIGPGDQISLEFPGRPELGGPKVVGPDGRITLPLVGAIAVSDKTRSQVATLVVGALSPYYKELSVTVSVDKYGSNRVVVLGNVLHPGVLYFDDTPTLLDVIARAGLLASTQGEPTSGHSAASVASARDGIPQRCAIYRGNDQVVWVDLRALLQSGNSMADLRLRRNDVVFVPAQQEVFVSVLGDVVHPGAVPLTPESTLTSILAQSGGPAEGASNNIQVIQPSTGKTMTISFKNLLTPQGVDEVQLHTGDVVFVPYSGLAKFTYVFQRISPIASMGIVSALIP
jgi:polysaccharide export outer membrane protein